MPSGSLCNLFHDIRFILLLTGEKIPTTLYHFFCDLFGIFSVVIEYLFLDNAGHLPCHLTSVGEVTEPHIHDRTDQFLFLVKRFVVALSSAHSVRSLFDPVSAPFSRLSRYCGSWFCAHGSGIPQVMPLRRIVQCISQRFCRDGMRGMVDGRIPVGIL